MSGQAQTEVDSRELVLVIVHPDGSMHDIFTGLHLVVGGPGVGFPGDSVADLQYRLRSLADWLEQDAVLSPHLTSDGDET